MLKVINYRSLVLVIVVLVFLVGCGNEETELGTDMDISTINNDVEFNIEDNFAVEGYKTE